MKKPINANDLPPEYRVDYSKAKSNRFARRTRSSGVVVLDDDVAKVFKDGESVNAVLRAIVKALPAGRSTATKRPS